MTSGTIASIGLAVSMLGAYFLAQGFILRFPREALKELSLPFMAGNPLPLRNAIHQNVEAWCGFALLFLGFLVQLTSYSSVFVSGTSQLQWDTYIAFGLFSLFVAPRAINFLASLLSRITVSNEWRGVLDALPRNIKQGTGSEDERKAVFIMAQALDVDVPKGAADLQQAAAYLSNIADRARGDLLSYVIYCLTN